jgi:hypothetical protein
MLNAEQTTQMEREGFVTIDTPFTAAEVGAAGAAADRAFGDRPGGFLGSDINAPELLHLILHPFVEAVAKQMLRADSIGLRAAALRKTPPEPGRKVATLEGEHADIRYSNTDLDSTPRGILCTVLIWLTDVTPTRAPLMFRPGSHRQLAQCHDGPAIVGAHSLDKLPKIAYVEPTPLLARAGQISVGTTGVIHSGSANLDTSDRKVIFTQFQARGVVPVHFDPAQQADIERYLTQVKPVVEPARRHLLWN